PGDPRQFVGQGDDRDIAMGPPHQLFRPSAERRVTLRDMRQRVARRGDQLFAQILVAALADSEQLRLTPGSELPRNQAQPCGEIAAVSPTTLQTFLPRSTPVAVVDVATPARIAGPGRRIDRPDSPIPVIVVPQR